MGHVIVLDASALVDLVLGKRDAGFLTTALDSGPICAPSHQPSEVLSALARMQRADELTDRACRVAAEAAMALPQELVLPSPSHVQRALALSPGVRVADGLYVALAEERRCPLLTTDLRLARSVSTCEVLSPTA